MFKKAIILLAALTVFSCKKEVKGGFATISGKITNHLGKDGLIQGKDYKKIIKIANDGTFKDTMHLNDEGASYSFSDGNEFLGIFLKNGDNVNLSLDTKMFDETAKFTGTGAETNNYLIAKSLLNESSFSSELFSLKKEDFEKQIDVIESKFTALIQTSKNVDKTILDQDTKGLLIMKGQLMKQYDAKAKLANLKGNPSPPFNYENYKGGKTSLASMKGKYVYIDVWATWCGPCKAEIPHLKKLEEALHGKNIEFVSISVDALDKHDKWKAMIADKKMGGVQLFADNSWKSDFVTSYGINGIPRFILIDPKGNVVNTNEKRPSNPATKAMLEKLLK